MAPYSQCSWNPCGGAAPVDRATDLPTGRDGGCAYRSHMSSNAGSHAATARATSVAKRPLPLAALAALAIAPLGHVWLAVGILGTLIAALVLVAGVRRADWPAVRVATLTLLMVGAALLGLPFGVWLAVGAMGLASRRFEQLAPDSGWLPVGRATPAARRLTGLTVTVAAIGLTWWALAIEDFGPTTLELVEAVRELPGAVLAAALVIFVVLNALTEEIAYRGFVFEAASVVFAPSIAVTAQAVAFGTLHIAGFPGGAVGVGLTFSYGLALGAVRHLTGGMRLPVLAHMAADATVALLVVAVLLPQFT